MKHKVQIGDGTHNNLYGLKKNEFEVGEEVTFSVLFATDCDVTVTSDEVQIMPGKIDDHYGSYVFSFVMPDKDVMVDVSRVNTMMRRNPEPVPQLTGVMGRFMGMNNGFGREKTQPKFCPECGIKLESPSQKYCRECGTELGRFM